ncbi:MAG: metallophosphoesterase [Capsulimonadales bacterium]|nr:metallophosphoesterase [Capsulimonadales bacterium]
MNRLICLVLLWIWSALAAGAQSGVFVQLTDTHLGKPAPYETPEKMERHLTNLRRIIEEINTVIRPDFVLVTGDTVSTTDEPSVRLVAETMRSLRVPYYLLPGNHDDGSVREGWFEKYLGPIRRTIEHGPWRIVGFDGRTLIRNEGPEETFAWLDAELSKPRGARQALIVASHYPLHIPDRWENSGQGRNRFQYTGAHALRLSSLLFNARVTGYIAGHTHGSYAVEDDLTGIPCFVSGAAQNGEYRVYSWEDGVLASVAAQAGKWPKVLVSVPGGRLPGGSAFTAGEIRIRARVFAPTPPETVEWICDEGTPVAMTRGTDGVWEARWNSTEVRNGKHLLTVRVKAGEETRSAEVAVAVSNRGGK